MFGEELLALQARLAKLEAVVELARKVKWNVLDPEKGSQIIVSPREWIASRQALAALDAQESLVRLPVDKSNVPNLAVPGDET